MTTFKVTIGIKEQSVEAASEGEAADKALQEVTRNIAWVSATRAEKNPTGFRPPEKPDEPR